MCGNMNGDPKDDLHPRLKQTAADSETALDSWKIST